MMHVEIVWDYSGVKWYSFYVQVLKALNLIMKTLLELTHVLFYVDVI